MDQSLENRIRERAYEIWTAHGRMHGQAEKHWLAAEREVLATSTAVLAGKTNPKKKPRPSHVRIPPKRSRGPADAAHHIRDARACSAAISTLSGCHGLGM
jgi:hypothetical protein